MKKKNALKNRREPSVCRLKSVGLILSRSWTKIAMRDQARYNTENALGSEHLFSADGFCAGYNKLLYNHLGPVQIQNRIVVE